MELLIEIIDGPQSGTRAKARVGLTLGRRDCDVNIEDPKVSGKHARIDDRGSGALWLVDQGSANGIRTSGSGKLTELQLVPGLTFRLGQTQFKVVLAEERSEVQSSGWRAQIIQLSERAIREADMTRKKSLALAAFPRSLKLIFNRGLQAGTEWTIGYGPRESGASSVDLPLFEPGAPAKCFRLQAKENEIIIKLHEEALGKILLNGKRFETAFIRQGDVLEIGNTRIEISL